MILQFYRFAPPGSVPCRPPTETEETQSQLFSDRAQYWGRYQEELMSSSPVDIVGRSYIERPYRNVLDPSSSSQTQLAIQDGHLEGLGATEPRVEPTDPDLPDNLRWAPDELDFDECTFSPIISRIASPKRRHPTTSCAP